MALTYIDVVENEYGCAACFFAKHVLVSRLQLGAQANKS